MTQSATHTNAHAHTHLLSHLLNLFFERGVEKTTNVTDRLLVIRCVQHFGECGRDLCKRWPLSLCRAWAERRAEWRART